VFLDASWVAVYLGQRVVPEGFDPRAALPPQADLLRSMAALRQEVSATAAAMPGHLDFIHRFCPMAEAA
jgi:tryptophan halogenase